MKRFLLFFFLLICSCVRNVDYLYEGKDQNKDAVYHLNRKCEKGLVYQDAREITKFRVNYCSKCVPPRYKRLFDQYAERYEKSVDGLKNLHSVLVDDGVYSGTYFRFINDMKDCSERARVYDSMNEASLNIKIFDVERWLRDVLGKEYEPVYKDYNYDEDDDEDFYDDDYDPWTKDDVKNGRWL